jgi:hypothetical protein
MQNPRLCRSGVMTQHRALILCSVHTQVCSYAVDIPTAEKKYLKTSRRDQSYGRLE